MCLLTNRIHPKKARKDITIYKVFFMRSERSYLVSPYRHTVYPIETDEITAVGDNIKSTRQDRIFKNRTVGEGYIHGFQYKASAELLALKSRIITEMNDFMFENELVPVVWECIVPKGTYYFKDNSSASEEIAAKKIKLIRMFTIW